MACPETCPNCKADMREPNSPGYFRVIALYDIDRDRTTDLKCPDCGHVWARVE